MVIMTQKKQARGDVITQRVFPSSFDEKTRRIEFEGNPHSSFEGQREFFDHLERELEAAWRAGYDYLSVEGPEGKQFYTAMVVAAQFIPHDDRDAVDEDNPLRRGDLQTYRLPEMFER